MYNRAVKERFVELRAQGVSYQKISEELNISKPTLIKWGREFEYLIDNIEYIKVQEILEKHRLLKNQRINALTEKLEQVWLEIESRDLSQEKLRDLIVLKGELERGLDQVLNEVKFHTGETKSSLPNVEKLLKL